MPPGVVTATFAVIGMLWMTRALHEEEFASLVNQYGTALDQEKKIGWLREERSVRYGTIGVILIIIMKIGAIASLASNDVVFQALIAACAWSRALMVVAASKKRMGEFRVGPVLGILGWLSTLVMAAAAVTMLYVSFK